MQVLTDHINAEYEENQHDNAGAIHPSSLGDCDRSAIYQYLGLEKDVEHSQFLKRVFFHGNRIEEWMNTALKRRGILIASSIPVKAKVEGVPVEGEIDHIIKWDRGWRIADTKSVSDFALRRYGHDLPYHHHVLQVGAYQWALGRMLFQGDGPSKSPEDWLKYLEERGYGTSVHVAVALSRIQRGAAGEQCPPIFLYVGRGNLEETPIEVGDQAQDWALEKLRTIADYINEDIIPDRPFRTPNEHRYKCARCTKKAGYKRRGKEGRDAYKEGNEPVYVPSCSYFKRCWGVLPVRWSFWSEVKKNDLPL